MYSCFEEKGSHTSRSIVLIEGFLVPHSPLFPWHSQLLKYRGQDRIGLNQVLLSSWLQKWEPDTIKQALAGGYMWMPGKEPRKERHPAAPRYPHGLLPR